MSVTQQATFTATEWAAMELRLQRLEKMMELVQSQLRLHSSVIRSLVE